MSSPHRASTRTRLLLATLLLSASQSPAALAQSSNSAATDTEQRAVMAPVQALFDFITTKDLATGQGALLVDARVVSVRQQAGKQVVRAISQPEFLKAILEAKQNLRERYWNAELRIHNSVASVTTPYDFWRDGQFSHCGVNLIDLVKTDDGWKIAGITYSAQTQCEASPLGPLKP